MEGPLSMETELVLATGPPASRVCHSWKNEQGRGVWLAWGVEGNTLTTLDGVIYYLNVFTGCDRFFHCILSTPN